MMACEYGMPGMSSVVSTADAEAPELSLAFTAGCA